MTPDKHRSNAAARCLARGKPSTHIPLFDIEQPMMFFRNHRRAKSDLSAAESSKNPSQSSTFSLTKTLSKSSTLFDDGVDDPKGALGLTLLYSPSEPQIDIIFVHGLGGGSRKTWSKTKSLAHFWPQEWLPKDPAFKSVRIHSYGYDSDYLKGKDDCLNIHHIGKSLLAEISTSPYFADSRTCILMVGHSMGGLVIKKAYIVARQDTAYEAIASRFVAFYFLATPHRGADSARTLKNILKVAYDRGYVADLERNSATLQVINDEFRHFSSALYLWSFYETRNMRFFSSLIVDPESAILGYPEEKQIPMAADHRSICKFETKFDANYIILRNSLAASVSKVNKIMPRLELKEQRDRIEDLKRYLGVSDLFDDDFLAVQETRLPGSCEWFSTKNGYVTWRDGTSDNARILWINGTPATGKSVLAGYVIHQLRKSNQDCSYFFFKHGDKSKSRPSTCLRSLAFQMACSNAEVRSIVLEMQSDGIQLALDDERTLWRTLFLSNIFPAAITQQYWIIDALDECANFSFFFDTMLVKLDRSISLKILVTSRNTPDLDRSFSGLGPNELQSMSILVADTSSDIRRLVEARMESLSVVDKDDRVSLVEKILSKSKGSFLWTVLVLNELLSSHSKNEINRVLEEVPRGMEPLYRRTLELMSQVLRGKELAKAVLMWVTCAVRPMTAEELNEALNLDINDAFPKLEESITALCGQLVAVDKFGKFQMVHETAREFLLDDKLGSEFAVNKIRAHTRIATVCLKYLVGEDMKPPRTNRSSSAIISGKRAAFSSYACAAYSYHLSKADPLASGLFQLVGLFLKSNILSWIEATAESQNLSQLIRTSRNLRAYLNACSIERSPLDPRMQALRGWATDLVRVAARFADALITAPSAIYSLVPPFCPTSSMIYNSVTRGRRLAVLGASNEQWDDRLSCIDFHQAQTSALCYGDEFLAVGLTTGAVALYQAISYQEYKVLAHGESVKFIRFGNKTDLVVTCGMKSIKVWDIRSGEVVYCFQSPQRPLDIVLDQNMLLVASHKNYIAIWNLGKDGLAEADRPWSNSAEHTNTPLRSPPCALSISISHGMLAVAYSGQPITMWDLEEDAYYGSCGKKLSSGETSTHVVVALVFNPHPNIGLLAVAYLDGDLALLDPFADHQLECCRANCQTLGASPNGRLLAGSAGNGTIHVYEFDTLRLLYRVKSSDIFIKQINFSRDSLHFADIRGCQCNVWEPAMLLRTSLSDDSSDSTSTSIVDTVSLDAKVKITAMLTHPTEDVVFCGKNDGAVVTHSRKSAECSGTLYSHKAPVRLMVWWQQSDVLMTVDASNRIFACRVQKTANKGWLADEMLFQSRLDSEKAIIHVLVGEVVGKFVISTRESDHLWRLDGQQEVERTHEDTPMIRKWILHPKSPLHMICVDGVDARIYRWSDLSEVATVSLLPSDGVARLQPKSLTLYPSGQERILLELSEREGSTRAIALMVLDSNSFSLEDHSSSPMQERHSNDAGPAAADKGKEVMTTPAEILLPPSPQITALGRHVAHVIGITSDSGRLVFLDRSSWVCSADLGDGGPSLGNRPSSLPSSAYPSSLSPSSPLEYLRHFFIPSDWFAGTRDVICALEDKDVLFAHSSELAVVRGCFDFAGKVFMRCSRR